MTKIFDDLKRLEEMQARLDHQFTRAAKHFSDKAGPIATGYAAVTEAIHKLRESDTYFNETIKALEESGTPEARSEAARMQMDRAEARPRCRNGGGRRRVFE